MSASLRRAALSYDEAEIAALFDRMGPSYDLINRVASFGFCELWRAQCVGNIPMHSGAVVIDLMVGSGECWTYVRLENVRHHSTSPARGRNLSSAEVRLR